MCMRILLCNPLSKTISTGITRARLPEIKVILLKSVFNPNSIRFLGHGLVFLLTHIFYYFFISVSSM